jgi:hypothetical protein
LPEKFTHARIANEHEIGPLLQEHQIEQAQDAILGLRPALVMVEVEGIDGGLRLQT